jgi:hypothetical protein
VEHRAEDVACDELESFPFLASLFQKRREEWGLTKMMLGLVIVTVAETRKDTMILAKDLRVPFWQIQCSHNAFEIRP